MPGLSPVALLRNIVWRGAFALRETGQALERYGCKLQGIYSHEEIVNRHTAITPVQYDAPSIGKDAFVAPSSLVLGKVSLGQASSVWYNATVRGDFGSVSIGAGTNIQDSAFVGATSEFSPAVSIGDNVSIGHGAILKGCTIGSNALIGMGAVISEGAQVGASSIIAAGAFVDEDAVVPPNEIWAGSPAKKLRDVKPAEKDYLRNLPKKYVQMAAEHAGTMELLELKQSEYSR